MNDNLIILISAIAGLISGTIASLIAPWVNWQIEKVRTRNQYRKEKIKKWRMEIERSSSFAEFLQTSTYTELKHRFSKEELKRFSSSHISIDRNPDVNTKKRYAARFHEEVNKKEKEWKLI